MQTITRKEFVLGLAVAARVNAIVDHVVITNGEGGYRYSKLAEALYGANLADESTGRSRLPGIRRQETLRAGQILGVRHHYFLDQKDDRFTLDTDDALDRLWDTRAVLASLGSILAGERYDAVITLKPDPSTHGHHNAAAHLVLDAIHSLPEADRPVVLGATNTGASGFVVSRTASLGSDPSLNYSIVVNWVISEHKSQGLLQRDCNRYDHESFHLLDSGSPASENAVRRVFQRLN